MAKNPWLAAILNIVLMGLGYVYTGKRIVFGVLLILVEILSFIWLYLNPTYVSIAMLVDPLVIIPSVLFLFALAWDAYQDAKKV